MPKLTPSKLTARVKHRRFGDHFLDFLNANNPNGFPTDAVPAGDAHRVVISTTLRTGRNYNLLKATDGLHPLTSGCDSIDGIKLVNVMVEMIPSDNPREYHLYLKGNRVTINKETGDLTYDEPFEGSSFFDVEVHRRDHNRRK